MEVLGSYSNPSVLSRLQAIPTGQRHNRVSDRPHVTRQLQRRLDAHEVDLLVAAYKDGSTVNGLASSFGVHRTTVIAHLDRSRVERRVHIVSRHIDEATRLYRQGWSLKRVGAHFGVDGETVRQALRAADVVLRPRPGWS